MSIKKNCSGALSLHFIEDDPFEAVLIKDINSDSILLNKAFKEMFTIYNAAALDDVIKVITENQDDAGQLKNRICEPDNNSADKPVRITRLGKIYNFHIFFSADTSTVVVHARDMSEINRLTSQLNDYAEGLVQNIFELEISQRRLIHARNRLKRQLQASSELGLTNYESYKNTATIFRIFTEIGSSTLEVQRCGIWLADNNTETYRCSDLFILQDSLHTDDITLNRKDAPEIFSQINDVRLIKIEDPLDDNRTKALAEIYFKPGRISSVLLATIVSKGKVTGVVSFEHTGTPRIWEDDECGFAVLFADHVARIMSDVEKHILESQLIQTQKMETIGTLVGGLAHDFNNLLGGIVGSSSLIRYNYKKIGEEGLLKYLDIIENASSRATDLVKQLLAVARKQDLALVPVDLNIAASHIIKIARNTFDRSIEIKYNSHPAPAITNADPIQIEQVLLNLCINACHVMTLMRRDDEPQGGLLSIDIKKIHPDKLFLQAHPESLETDYWMILVEDTGVGMNKNVLERLFEPFFTTKKNTRINGSGLGLTMVYNIIHAHNGFIDVLSEPGKGSVFKVYLPVLANEYIEEKFAPEEKAVKGEGLILVIDDEELMRITSKTILEFAGYSVITAENGDEGIAVFKKQPNEITAVILDMSMPKKSGRDTFYELKKLNPEVKVLLSTGFLHDERCEEILKEGVKGFIQKPFTVHELSVALYKVINS